MKVVQKILKYILVGTISMIGIIVVGVLLLLLFAGYKNENYWKFANPKGVIEEKYASLGEYEVSSAQFDADNDLYKKISVWYPAELGNSKKTYPLVLMVNGTGAKASASSAGFRHLASWGFIVVGNEDENTRTGESTAATLNFMLALNKNPQSTFYSRINTENIGIAGHSQGGVGAINAVTQQENGKMYKAICAQSTTSSAVAYALNQISDGWNCSTSTISIPSFMVAGTGSADAGNVDENRLELADGEIQGICPLWWLRECFDIIPDSTPKVIARLTGKDHGDIPHSADSYMTAWFMYWLNGDEDAGKAFFGENAEILSNKNWQDIQINRQ